MMRGCPRQVSPFAFFCGADLVDDLGVLAADVAGVSRSPCSSRRSSAGGISGAAALSEVSSSSSVSAHPEGVNDVEQLGVFD